MTRSVVVLDLADNARLAADLAAGGVFVPGCTVGINEDCDLLIKGDHGQVTVAARVVWVDDTGRGAGLELIDCDMDTKRKIFSIAVSEPDTVTTAKIDPDDAEDSERDGEPASAAETEEVLRKTPAHLHERLRGLTLAAQIKLAHNGEAHERIVLERLYGKNVWEALLRNPRLTAPEVARIARMGTLPRVLVEIIVGNGGWLQIPEVRRALLANPRLGTDQILRVLRLLPKPELKIAAMQTAYPLAVRDAAKRMLRDGS
jgi:hypothetical protein